MPVYAEGRVEHQKLNQTTALLLFGWVFGVQLDYSLRLKSVSATAGKRVGILLNWYRFFNPPTTHVIYLREDDEDNEYELSFVNFSSSSS